ncbi:MAG: cation-translocating P-type ATPase [Desulfotomaculum sp.]|nr:cation-translocating P-type ATPase [Desulfotomaculum sp.]
MTNVFYLKGLDCPDCGNKLENSIKELASVKQAQLTFALGKLEVEYTDETEKVVKLIKEHGCSIAKETNGEVVSSVKEQEQHLVKTNNFKKIIFQVLAGGVVSAVVSGTVLLLAVLLWLLEMPETIVITSFAGAIIIGGWATAHQGIKSLAQLKFDMNVLMIVALTGAVFIGEWLEGAIIAFLFALSHTLENYSLDKTRQAVKELMTLAPPTATVKKTAQEMVLPIEQVQVGDIVIVRPGERMAMDGKVIVGSSWVNEAPVTGESSLVAKTVAATVYAGTVNEGGYLEISVTKLARESTVSKIIQLVEKALADKPPVQKFIDRFAAYYTPAILVIALGMVTIPTLILGQELLTWIYRALALLLVACPCALIISTPVALVTAMGSAAKTGVLIKGGFYLEQMAKVKTIAFDKTGTLTKGKPRISNVTSFDIDQKIMLQAAYSLEKMSEHPLAKSLCLYAGELGITTLPVALFKVQSGQGVTGQLKQQGSDNAVTWLIGNIKFLLSSGVEIDEQARIVLNKQVASGDTVIGVGCIPGSSSKGILAGLISFRDELRPETIEAMLKIKKLGLDTVMLTGDNTAVANKIANLAAIKQVASQLLPGDKLTEIKKITESKGAVAMVGDGINDAPALAQASVGIAMGASGTDTALETADVALLGDDLNKISFLVVLSRKTLRIIKQNIVMAIGLKLIAVALITTGFFTLWMAVLADMGTTLVVTLNGLRLLKIRDIDVSK